MLIPPPSTLSKDSHLADWTVVVNGEKAFQVNSTALAGNSRYFFDTFVKQKRQVKSKSGQLARVTRFEYHDLEVVKDTLEFISKVSNVSERLSEADLVDLLDVERLRSRLQAALHFGVPRLIDGILSSAQRNLNCGNCWQVLAAASDPKVGCSLLEDIAIEFILRNFCDAAEQQQFVSCASFEHLCRLLQSNYLNVPDEHQLLDILYHWVEADEASRLHHFPPLLSHLRLGRLTTRQIDRISANHLARKTTAESEFVINLAITASVSASHFLAMEQTDPPLIRELLLPRLPHQAIFLCGGWEGNLQEATIAPSFVVQLYDPISCTWARHDTFLPAMDTRHAYSACVELDCTVYLIGGFVQPRAPTLEMAEPQGPTARMRAYCLRRNIWRERAPMHEARNFVSACRCLGRLYVMGGHNGHARLNSAEAYDPQENRWTHIASMQNVRSDACATTLKGLVYVCGGFSGTRFLASAEQYNPDMDQWTLLANMPTGRSGLSVCAFDKYIYALGGNSGTQRLATVERYDPDSNQWIEVEPMFIQRSNFCACVLHDFMYVIGGWSDQTRSTVRSVERCRLDSSWELGARLELPISACSCCAVAGCHLIEPLLLPHRYLMTEL